MGSVLIAVNPLMPTPDPEGALGTSKAARNPHPWAIAESAYQQMSFAADNRRKRSTNGPAGMGDAANQSVITSGESGSGKTESSKVCDFRSSVPKQHPQSGKHILPLNQQIYFFGFFLLCRHLNPYEKGKGKNSTVFCM
jgi:myosin heavy subunit